MIVFLGLGSNRGDKKNNLEQAIALLSKTEGLIVKKISSFYETEPWGGVEQDSFLNMVLEIETTLSPLELLKRCQEIEQKLGRVREKRWGPRTIDIDILTYGDLQLKSETLNLPHPYLEVREFVLAPLREIAPDFVLPSGKKAKNVKGEGKIKIILP
ncbi:MAG: 2-amino-4-hydroxy-6-hydroxymethyldihydropteridine diphosphokinase [Desulfitobacteriia bacterium]|jgi:2-amino-4-hydroxy-6-hydroxymethyldihydropteridine diphosphokinase